VRALREARQHGRQHDVSQPVYGAAVVGGGVVGLAAAWHLQRLGCRPVAVVERFGVGHDRGSSHGSVRMTRSTYANPAYAALMRHVHAEEWPLLERAAGATLVHRGDVIFFGPDRTALGTYAAAVRAAGADVDRLSPGEARRRFPSLRFPDDAEILHDRTGGTIAAAETIQTLRRMVASAEGVVLEDMRVLAIEPADPAVRIVSDRGAVLAERVVIATGAWLPELVPAARQRLFVVPQTIAYVRLGVPAQSLPSWVHFGGADRGLAYGLAERGRDALKVGRHVTSGEGADPDRAEPASADEVKALERELGQILAVPVRETLGSETCPYTMTASEEFIIDTWEGEPRVAFASACSGHGFKFAPLTGRLLAELVVRGRADLPGGLDRATLFGLRGDGQPAA
jgi:sarcosine oxidase